MNQTKEIIPAVKEAPTSESESVRKDVAAVRQEMSSKGKLRKK